MLVSHLNSVVKAYSIIDIRISHEDFDLFDKVLVARYHVVKALAGIFHLESFTMRLLVFYHCFLFQITLKASFPLERNKSAIMFIASDKFGIHCENFDICFGVSVVLELDLGAGSL